ncbi:hypothetical protein DID73_01225 [Candidatus Marinamargulisbacteria bacterium SCGC AG-343-K17]|nr:hypothetical protein DID73_01225 [Candidatus Marinamargulisbacteria bacterium SCGC AG-343-K17]
MSVHNASRYDELLQNEEYHTILIELEGTSNPEDLLVKGIAHYKLNQADEANTVFKNLHASYPSNEITAYFIITKLKLNDVMAASKLYNELCFEENKAILNDIKSNCLEQAINRCLFLQSIPVERPNLEAAATVEQDINNSNYKAAIEKLAPKAETSSCSCC